VLLMISFNCSFSCLQCCWYLAKTSWNCFRTRTLCTFSKGHNIDDTNEVGNDIDDNVDTIDKSNTSIDKTIVDNNTIIVRVHKKRRKETLIIATRQLHVMLHVLIE
jgi:hypothetical protein